jgi:tRNA 2-thiouridine synthesizing protein E
VLRRRVNRPHRGWRHIGITIDDVRVVPRNDTGGDEQRCLKGAAAMIPSLAKPAVEFNTLPAGAFDADGFLAEPAAWTPAVAAAVARLDGLDALTAKHWEVIGLVRGRYYARGALPVMRLICRAAGLDRDNAHRLFSSCRSMWRIAGLPNPGEEAKTYMN